MPYAPYVFDLTGTPYDRMYAIYCEWKGPSCLYPGPPLAPGDQWMATAGFPPGQVTRWVLIGMPDTQESVDASYGQICDRCRPAYLAAQETAALAALGGAVD